MRFSCRNAQRKRRAVRHACRHTHTERDAGGHLGSAHGSG